MSKRRPAHTGLRGKPKRPRKGISLDVKLDILRRFDAGEKLSAIAKTLVLAKSTVGTIKDNRDKIEAIAQVATPVSARTLYLHRSEVMLNMERLLSAWIEEQTQGNVPLNPMVIQAKARSLYNNLVKEKGSDAPEKRFLASKGWFDRFCKRFNLHNFKISSDATGADVDDVINSPRALKKIIYEGGYLPEQVFNVAETGLFWKRVPDRTFISKEEKSAPGFQASKDRLTLLLGGNAAGDFKLKPLLVYGTENPRALEGYAKPHLPVIWHSNRKACMTVAIFHDWFINYFCPAVERYCAQRNISNKALLVIDNAPSHPLNLNDLSDSVRVEYLPKETSALIQPMHQGAITQFMRFYLRRTLKQLVDAADGGGEATVGEFWKGFNIMNAIDNIAESWDELQVSTMNGVWQNIWPGCIINFTDVPAAEPAEKVTRDIVTLANEAGFEDIVEEDVIQLLDSHEENLSNEDLMLLEQERASEDADVTEAPATPLQLTTHHLSETLSYIDRVVDILSANDPSRERSLKAVRLLHDAMGCYREMYKEKMRREQQSALDAFLVCKTEPPSPPM
ncbi:tigger transposable element-derived protein 1-like [Pristis pectinata]|uniref:tigger transposable element-derived protein 1-like n=1 Tax=Pristis pectinata TaxID=685728 RepID=UPI00223E1287|nr:tigger transposable element-derived protein 1-like [Pristis pectinata]XP_051865281.1 tigger transposable element-derived protein 1-like [Pristis pectinata]XP_051865282.1 tigger transposable element-derived protein 1-like [Pristis pectinata]